MTVDSKDISGGCLCGAIRYVAEQAPSDIGYCHCTMCQKGLGGPFGVAAIFSRDTIRFLSGEPAWYASSDLVRRGFCVACGSPIAYERNDSDEIAIWVGTLDEPGDFEPKAHFWTDSRLPWVDIQARLPDETAKLSSYEAALAREE